MNLDNELRNAGQQWQQNLSQPPELDQMLAKVSRRNIRPAIAAGAAFSALLLVGGMLWSANLGVTQATPALAPLGKPTAPPASATESNSYEVVVGSSCVTDASGSKCINAGDENVESYQYHYGVTDEGNGRIQVSVANPDGVAEPDMEHAVTIVGLKKNQSSQTQIELKLLGEETKSTISSVATTAAKVEKYYAELFGNNVTKNEWVWESVKKNKIKVAQYDLGADLQLKSTAVWVKDKDAVGVSGDSAYQPFLSDMAEVYGDKDSIGKAIIVAYDESKNRPYWFMLLPKALSKSQLGKLGKVSIDPGANPTGVGFDAKDGNAVFAIVVNK